MAEKQPIQPGTTNTACESRPCLAGDHSKCSWGCPSLTREEQISRMAKHVEDVKQRIPELGLDIDPGAKAFTTDWYVPGIHFTADCRERLSPESLDKFNAVMAQLGAPDYQLQDFSRIRDECTMILGEDEDLKERFSKIFHDGEAFVKMREHREKLAAKAEEESLATST